MRNALLIATALLVSGAGCREPPKPPSQQAVEYAQHQSDQAGERADAARDEANHAGRLRDIDRLRYDADRVTFREQMSTLGGLATLLTLVLLVALLWLAVEIRRRRVVNAVMKQVLQQGGAIDERS